MLGDETDSELVLEQVKESYPIRATLHVSEFVTNVSDSDFWESLHADTSEKVVQPSSRLFLLLTTIALAALLAVATVELPVHIRFGISLAPAIVVFLMGYLAIKSPEV